MRPRLLATLTVVALWSPTLAEAQVSFDQSYSLGHSEAGFLGLPRGATNNDVLRLALLGTIATAWANTYDDRAVHTFATEKWWGGEVAGVEVLDLGDEYGYGLYLAGFSATAWGVGAATGKSKLRTTGRRALLALAIDGALVTSIKLATRRARPDRSDRRSFPSGHTSGAFTFSTVMSRQYGWKVGLPAYTLASLTAIARMEDSRHYASDVVAGAFLGIIVGRIATPTNENERGIRPYAGPTGAGLQYTF